MTRSSTGLRTGIMAALMIGILGALTPAHAADNGTQCTLSLAQYDASIKQLAAASAKAEAMAEQNPIYESDVQYYAIVLAQAERCHKSLNPLTTVSR